MRQKVIGFHPKMHQKPLAARLCPDPLRELTVLPQTLYLDLRDRGRDKRRGQGRGKQEGG